MRGESEIKIVGMIPVYNESDIIEQVIDKMKSEGKLQKKEVMNMCKGCHKDMAEKGQKAGPVSCKECHKK